jgi:hypothetical protein
MRTPRFVVLLILAAALPSLARATQLQVTSSTQYLWNEDLLANHLDQARVAQYLRLNASSLDQDGQISFYGYGRMIGNLTRGADQDSDVTGRLYYFFLDYRNVVKDHLDLKVGRTYVTAAAIPGVVDGIYLNARNLGPLGLGATAFGGRRVIFDDQGELGGLRDGLGGASVYVNTVKSTHAELSVAQKYADDRFAQAAAALDFSTTPHAVVNVAGRVKYDLVDSRVSDLLIDLNLAPHKDLVVRGEFCETSPTFDKVSFYRFFKITSYKELGATVEVLASDRYRISGRFAAEDFDHKSSAHVWGAGLFANPVDALTLNVHYDDRIGFGNRLSGLRLDGAYRVGKAALQAGIDYDDFRRADSRDDTAKLYWVGGELHFTKAIAATFRAARVETFYLSHGYQGFVALNINI